jgi:hypothetical protein
MACVFQVGAVGLFDARRTRGTADDELYAGSADESQLYPFTHHDLEYFRENMSEAQAAEMERRQMRQAYAAAKMQQIREQVEKEQREKANG